jgi:hypothetical protein
VGNEQLKFDEVVVTTPLGWLKKNQDAFSPHLPVRFSNALNNLGWGSLEKVFKSSYQNDPAYHDYRSFSLSQEPFGFPKAMEIVL